MNVRVADAPLPAVRTRFADFVALLKLRLNVLVLFAVLAGFWLAVPTSAAVPVGSLVLVLLGVLFSGGGSSAINMGLEGELDRLMERTRSRPVAAGRIAASDAIAFGAGCSLLGTGLVYLGGGIVAAALTAATVLLYVFVYTPLKTRSPLNTLVGAIPGALPPLIGWTAASGGSLSLPALSCFGIVFLWQFPHFLAIASLYREDYARAGYAMLPVVDPSGLRTAHRAVAYAIVLVPVSLLPTFGRLTGPTYFVGALVLTLSFLAFAVRAAMLRTTAGWRDLLRASLVALPGIFALMMADRLPS